MKTLERVHATTADEARAVDIHAASSKAFARMLCAVHHLAKDDLDHRTCLVVQCIVKGIVLAAKPDATPEILATYCRVIGNHLIECGAENLPEMMQDMCAHD